jgi:hypothetical protein
LDEVERERNRHQAAIEESSHIFNLEEAPLFRVRLNRCQPGEYDLVFNIHHLITDGWSMEILIEEFFRLYEARKQGVICDLEPLQFQYRDYAAWQNRLLADKEKMGKAKAFWRRYLSGTLPVLNLPYDFPRIASEGSKASSGYRWVIPESLSIKLREMAAGHRTSLFMVLLAGFNLLLSQVTGQKDIMLGIPAAARQHDALKNIVGMFVNTLIIRSSINPGESFKDFFNRLQDNIFNVLDYQDFPLELICSELKIKYPQLAVFFNMLNIGPSLQETLSNFESRHMEKVQAAKFDIVCYLKEYKNGIEMRCHYFRNRFKPATIEMLMDMYKKMLDKLCSEPVKKVGEYTFTRKKKKLNRHN